MESLSVLSFKTQWQGDIKGVTFLIIFDGTYCRLFFRSAVFSVNKTYNY